VEFHRSKAGYLLKKHVVLVVTAVGLCINFVYSDVGPQFSRSGISGKGKNIVTKHDPEICGRKNARKVMENVRNVFFLSLLSYALSFSALML